MKTFIFIILLLLQANAFTQDIPDNSAPRIIFERDSIKIVVEDRINNKDYYQKIVFYKNKYIEYVIEIGLKNSVFSDMRLKDWNIPNIGAPLLENFSYKNLKNNIFYNDDFFSFTVVKGDHFKPMVVFFQYKKEKGQWNLNKMVEYPFYFSDTGSNGCNVFFISEDIVYIDEWGLIGESEDFPQGGECHWPYIVVLGENGNYTRFLQEDKPYPPKRPPYIIPSNPKH